jgi:hypothetical protein
MSNGKGRLLIEPLQRRWFLDAVHASDHAHGRVWWVQRFVPKIIFMGEELTVRKKREESKKELEAAKKEEEESKAGE